MARAAAEAAAAIIEELGPRHVVAKSDGSPVTAADVAANEAIVQRLARHFPRDGLLSEESADGDSRLTNPRVWIIDPLDGTRDFVEGTGQFAVHVALAVQGAARLGVVLEPAARRMSWAVSGHGAFMSERGGPAVPLRVSDRDDAAGLRVGTSRFAINAPLRAFLDETPALRPVTMGASTKMMALARGELDACVWLSAKEKQWDTCAPEVIVNEAGGLLTDVEGHRFVYNGPDVVHRRGIVASNGVAHAWLLARARRHWPSGVTP